MEAPNRIAVLGVPLAGKSSVLETLAVARGGRLTNSILSCPEPGPFFGAPLRLLHLLHPTGKVVDVEFICLPGGSDTSWALPLLHRATAILAVVDPQRGLELRQREYFHFYRTRSEGVPWFAVITKSDLVAVANVPAHLSSLDLPADLPAIKVCTLGRVSLRTSLRRLLSGQAMAEGSDPAAIAQYVEAQIARSSPSAA